MQKLNYAETKIENNQAAQSKSTETIPVRKTTKERTGPSEEAMRSLKVHDRVMQFYSKDWQKITARPASSVNDRALDAMAIRMEQLKRTASERPLSPKDSTARCVENILLQRKKS